MNFILLATGFLFGALAGHLMRVWGLNLAQTMGITLLVGAGVLFARQGWEES